MSQTRTPDTITVAVRALYGETHRPASARNAYADDSLRALYELEAVRPTPHYGDMILGLLRTCAVLIAERDEARGSLRNFAIGLEDVCDRKSALSRGWCEQLAERMRAASEGGSDV